MRTSLKILSVGAALTSMAVCLPMEIFNRDVVALAKCFGPFVAKGTWGPECQAVVARPGLLPASKLVDLTLDFTAGAAPRASSTKIVGSLANVGVFLPATTIKYKVDMSFNGAVIGELDVLNAQTSMTASALTTSLDPTALTIAADAQVGFAAFVKALVTGGSVPIPLEGKMDISFNVPIPFLGVQARTITGIGYQTITVFPGLKGLPDVKVVGETAITVNATAKKVTIAYKVSINVASTLSVKLGNVVFNTVGSAGVIGTTTFKVFTLVHGNNLIEAVTVVDLNAAGAADFVTGLNRAEATLTLAGFEESTANPLTASAVAALKLTVALPKNSTPVTL